MTGPDRMFTTVTTETGDVSTENEDYVLARNDTIVVVDGLTARTESGCIHGVAWYVRHLSTAIINRVALGPTEALAGAIRDTADLHRDTCDLTHPGTPAAVVAVAQCAAGALRYCVLGDTTLVLDTTAGLTIVTDTRMRQTALAERAVSDSYPIGSPEKARSLVRMKRIELAARNVRGGYWAAASDPEAAEHALTGAVALADLHRGAALTDGAARLVDPFGAVDWTGLLDLLSTAGPRELLLRVRAVEESDPDGVRWPRNKKSDDATAAYFVPSEPRIASGA